MGNPCTITAIMVKDIQQQPSHKMLWGSGLVSGILFIEVKKKGLLQGRTLPLSALFSSQIVLHCS